MIKFRHLIWMMIAAVGLMLSASQSFAQQPDVGDQPGLLPDDSVQLAPGIPQADGATTAPPRRRAPSSSRPRSAISI